MNNLERQYRSGRLMSEFAGINWYERMIETNKETKMRELTDHIVSGDQAVQLKIEVTDEPGAGGANHRYEVTGFRASTKNNPSCLPEDEEFDGTCILFQNGPIKESGVNGITQEALLAIVIDRLRSFQNGPFACDDNQGALIYCQDALRLLQRRTKARIARGVEKILQAAATIKAARSTEMGVSLGAGNSLVGATSVPTGRTIAFYSDEQAAQIAESLLAIIESRSK